MRLLPLILLSACGRIDFDARADAPQVLGPWGPPTLVLQERGDDPTASDDRLLMMFNPVAEIAFVTRASVDEPWSASQVDADLTSSGVEAEPELSADGLTVYFGSDRASPLDLDIWRSTRATRTSAWSPPVRVAELSSSFNESSGAVSADGLEIVFGRDGETPMRDLFRATRDAIDQPWSAPVPIAELNTAADDAGPFLSADRRLLYFDSDRAGSRDLYVARREHPEDSFGSPEPISELNSSGFNEHDPWVSLDGRHLYYTSNRNGTSQVHEATR